MIPRILGHYKHRLLFRVHPDTINNVGSEAEGAVNVNNSNLAILTALIDRLSDRNNNGIFSHHSTSMHLVPQQKLQFYVKEPLVTSTSDVGSADTPTSQQRLTLVSHSLVSTTHTHHHQLNRLRLTKSLLELYSKLGLEVEKSHLNDLDLEIDKQSSTIATSNASWSDARLASRMDPFSDNQSTGFSSSSSSVRFGAAFGAAFKKQVLDERTAAAAVGRGKWRT